MFLIKRNVILFLFSCCTFLSAAEKVVIERPADSEIQSIVIEEDSFIIKSKGKIYTFKFSDLLKDKSVQAKKPVPKNLEEAFKYNGEWCFFNFIPSKLNRLCYLDNNKNAYKVFKKGDLLERVLYKNKYYARDLSKNMYRPGWEIKQNFSPHLIPAQKYLDALDNKIRLLKIEINTIEEKNSTALFLFKSEQESYNAFLTANNIIIKKIDSKGNIIIKESSGKYSLKVQKELKHRYQQLQKQEEDMKAAISGLESSKDILKILEEFKRKLNVTYQKYVINGSTEIPKPPIDICF